MFGLFGTMEFKVKVILLFNSVIKISKEVHKKVDSKFFRYLETKLNNIFHLKF